MSGPCQILVRGGKPTGPRQSVPAVPLPDASEHRVSFAAHIVRERRPLTISQAQAQEYGRRGAKASRGKRE